MNLKNCSKNIENIQKKCAADNKNHEDKKAETKQKIENLQSDYKKLNDKLSEFMTCV